MLWKAAHFKEIQKLSIYDQNQIALIDFIFSAETKQKRSLKFQVLILSYDIEFNASKRVLITTDNAFLIRLVISTIVLFLGFL
ncbi:MAG: hypothetical protein TECD_00132 [Hyphomicrobiaceae bacterium hypho_1]